MCLLLIDELSDETLDNVAGGVKRYVDEMW